ncbi:MAG: chitobiase/beta-hexosaminidase C-terminal domain-containing protein, partial [Muribaculaceae bacterium]|nr:chitobiase/beta-hexosaminidase C-terminal domain-containing protein [Muribaculaceae bacterium]
MFHSFGRDNGAISYEYWFDSDYDAKQTGSLNVGSNHLDLDISSLPKGAHYYNIRLGYGDGSWGTVYRKMVLNLAGNVNAVAYEYWIDNNYSAKTEGTLAPGANSYTVDLTGVRRGLHRFNYRLMTGEGVWGAPFTSYFYSESNAARFTQYEYWLDNDYANHVTGNATGNPTSFEVDLSNFDKSGGAHYFHLRTRDGDGDWSPVYRQLLVFNKTEKRQPIIGYRHYLDGTDLGYVEVERQFVDSYMFEVSLPDSLMPSVRNRKPSFDGDRVFLAGADSIDYTMHVRTEFGWAAPQNWKLGIGNDFSTTAVAMEINSRHTFAAPADLGFAAMKFTAAGDSLYFRSDIPVALDIYKGGERVAALTPAQVKGMAMLRLEAGEYFGVLYGVEDAEAKEFTLHLMDTPNRVPMPNIEYKDAMVNITCTRADAQIRYTLDNNEPDEKSELFSQPFPLKRNAVIKAKAWVPDSDIEPSAVAEFTIDSYKVATPKGSFDVKTRLLTLTCDTV